MTAHDGSCHRTFTRSPLPGSAGSIRCGRPHPFSPPLPES
ncbi:hypothetical protein FM103_06095 [Corynebacterium xerosis]|nr:hypothetical protein FM103_06095 [Corynebacterium xerosis]